MRFFVRCALGAWLMFATVSTFAADSLVWNANQQRISAEIGSWPLSNLLASVTAETGWQIYLEPDTTHNVSAKFANLPLGEALRSLLGNLSFALVPQTNAPAKLFVFRTSMQKATQLISPTLPATASSTDAKPIPNELIVRLKPGAKIEDIARLLGAKVVGRIDALNAYRLRFDDEAGTQAARESLLKNPDVANLDYNYLTPPPPTALPALAGSVPPPSLILKPPGDTGRIIVGLIDTAVQPLGNGLDDFLLPSLHVAGDAQLDPTRPSHGSSMAETILSSIQSTTRGSTSVQILPVDVYGANPTSSTFDVAYGIVQAVNAGANPINLSLGSYGDSPLLHSVIQSASQRGIVFLAAAGNDPVTTPFLPAAWPEVVAVTAGVPGGQIAPYANRGSFVDVIAPGTSIIYYGGRAYYVSGTSPATAYFTGMVAGTADSSGRRVTEALSVLQNSSGIRQTRQP